MRGLELRVLLCARGVRAVEKEGRGRAVLVYPHPGCFVQRVRKLLSEKELLDFAVQKGA
jgi:hypothetical protein